MKPEDREWQADYVCGLCRMFRSQGTCKLCEVCRMALRVPDLEAEIERLRAQIARGNE